ncbi:MAG: hypothetical protein IT285_01915 [Bdellovibrionales bacterium]|nr:hypothetical protein [Bdellovibrionales bacterium]
MTLLDEAVREKLYDVRVVEKNVDRKIVARKEWDKVVSTLGQDEDTASWISLEELAAQEHKPTVGNVYTEPKRGPVEPQDE